ncbi:MAG: FAD-dependent oxidoreductase [Anaerolineae bacterium]
MVEQSTDVLIVGGGLGGIAAALSVVRLGYRTILTEPTDWLGGQLTAQAVPPDENPWIEQTGATMTYRLLRHKIRDYYKRNYPLLPEHRDALAFNPGKGWVSPLCHEPRVAVAVIDEMLAPYRADRQVDVRLWYVPVAVETDGDHSRAVTFDDKRSGEKVTITAPYIIDASELGDLLELGGVEYVIGAESQDDTGEMHALPGAANPLDQQAMSWCFALDHRPDEDHTIPRPQNYDYWRSTVSDFWPGPQLSWEDVDPVNLQPRTQSIFGHAHPDMTSRYKNGRWHYRRIFYTGYYAEGRYSSDVSLVNWPQIDYWEGPLLGVNPAEAARHLERARSLSLSFLHWMQTEAPRTDGNQGYPGLRLRGDVTDTSHGLAKAPYIRESRRIQAEFRIMEQHIGYEQRGDLIGAERFNDSVGIGSYRIDLHPSGYRSYVDIPTWPFQIPLGALIPVRMENLLPANKNIGTTHITNGAYRLHPVEWNIGEAVGALVAYCLTQQVMPRQVRHSLDRLIDFQNLLVKLGCELEWPEFARTIPRTVPQLKWVIPERREPYSKDNRP